MPTPIPFTENYDDLSTDKGFQFKFYCRRCSNGFMSSFQYNVTNVASDLLRAAGSFLGGMFESAADSTYQIQRAVGGPAHDSALRAAVEELSPRFKQCPRCGQWTCHEVCFNDKRGMCCDCSPKIEHEIKRIEDDATLDQLRGLGNLKNMTGGLTVHSAVTDPVCTSCRSFLEPGKKFCGECGAPAPQILAACPTCQAALEPTKKFCSECGT